MELSMWKIRKELLGTCSSFVQSTNLQSFHLIASKKWTRNKQNLWRHLQISVWQQLNRTKCCFLFQIDWCVPNINHGLSVIILQAFHLFVLVLQMRACNTGTQFANRHKIYKSSTETKRYLPLWSTWLWWSIRHL